jgi:hypothetical protein
VVGGLKIKPRLVGYAVKNGLRLRALLDA